MTRALVIAGVKNFNEQRINQLNLDPWIDVEISSIVHRKRYWWRKQTNLISTVIGQANYDLSVIDPYFEQMVRLNWEQAANSTSKMNYVENIDSIQTALNSNMQGTPANYYFVPGQTQQIGLSPIPNAVYSLRMTYWRAFVSPASYDDTQQIPIIPPQFHYLVMLMTMKRAALYLFGQQDPRYTALKTELEGTDGMGGLLGDLDRSQFSVESVDEWRSTDHRSFAKATGV